MLKVNKASGWSAAVTHGVFVRVDCGDNNYWSFSEAENRPINWSRLLVNKTGQVSTIFSVVSPDAVNGKTLLSLNTR